MKYLIVGLGNIGKEYAFTRHNIGFDVLNSWAKEADFTFTLQRLATVAQTSYKGRQIYFIQPTTYMNLSGKSCKILDE
jgi:PTH1 family peptidyl-tRNA hydrolase